MLLVSENDWSAAVLDDMIVVVSLYFFGKIIVLRRYWQAAAQCATGELQVQLAVATIRKRYRHVT